MAGARERGEARARPLGGDRRTGRVAAHKDTILQSARLPSDGSGGGRRIRSRTRHILRQASPLDDLCADRRVARACRRLDAHEYCMAFS